MICLVQGNVPDTLEDQDKRDFFLSLAACASDDSSLSEIKGEPPPAWLAEAMADSATFSPSSCFFNFFIGVHLSSGTLPGHLS